MNKLFSKYMKIFLIGEKDKTPSKYFGVFLSVSHLFNSFYRVQLNTMNNKWAGRLMTVQNKKAELGVTWYLNVFTPLDY